MPLQILTEIDASRKARDAGAGNAILTQYVRDAQAAGRAAFWSMHRYGDQVSVSASYIAQTDGLEAACRHVMAQALPGEAADCCRHFLSKLYPANVAGQSAIARALSTFLATFDLEAA